MGQRTRSVTVPRHTPRPLLTLATALQPLPVSSRLVRDPERATTSTLTTPAGSADNSAEENLRCYQSAHLPLPPELAVTFPTAQGS